MGYAGPAKEARRRKSYKTFWVAAVLGLLCGLADFGAPLEDLLRDTRTAVRKHAPSDDIVLVAIDDRSIAELQSWPWPRRHHGTLINELNRLGAKEVFFDIDFSSPSDAENDEVLGSAIARSAAPVTLPVWYVKDENTGRHTDLLPHGSIGRNAKLASINVVPNFLGQVRELHFQVKVGENTYPSFASAISGVEGASATRFPIDFSIDPARFKTVSASDVMFRRAPAGAFAEKKVLVGFTSRQINDVYLAPNYGMTPGVLFHALGAETLKAGRPTVLGWWVAFLVAAMVLVAASFMRSSAHRVLLVAATTAILGALQFTSEHYAIFFDVLPAILTLLILGGKEVWASLKQIYTRRGRTNAVSGLPTLQALLDSAENSPGLIVAKVHNYSEIAAAFGADGQAKLVDKLSDRLALITHGSSIYQGEEGVFAWLSSEESEAAKVQIESLYEIFRLPLMIGKRPIDVSLTFGIDTQFAETPSIRLGGALVAADKALKIGSRWKIYDPAEATETAWRLSLMGQLGRAVAEEDIWVAFQPKLDLATGRIVGAEALARWSHPEQGEISPADFVPAAEQNGRIDELTHYVLRRAIKACSRLPGQGEGFGVAVNISASLIGSASLASTVETLLRQYKLPPHRLTLEITETAALAAADQAHSEALKHFRRLGVRLSIDDYGTGLSTMDYLKRIPASELKIDRSFIRSIETSRTDRLMVRSTIDLAHSLGQTVVAEGVERAKTLRLLKEMGCDVAQGFLIGKPVPFHELEALLSRESKAA